MPDEIRVPKWAIVAVIAVASIVALTWSVAMSVAHHLEETEETHTMVCELLRQHGLNSAHCVERAALPQNATQNGRSP